MKRGPAAPATPAPAIHVHAPAAPAVAIDPRAACWIRAFAGVAGANDCKSVDIAITWADKALAAFDARFPRGQA